VTDYWKRLWQRLSGQESKDDPEVARIAALQQAAALRRAEHAQQKEQSDASPAGALSASRKRMEDAESAHAAALQKWENKQSRQKSR